MLVLVKIALLFSKVLDGVQRIVMKNGILDISPQSNMKIVSRNNSKYLR